MTYCTHCTVVHDTRGVYKQHTVWHAAKQDTTSSLQSIELTNPECLTD